MSTLVVLEETELRTSKSRVRKGWRLSVGARMKQNGNRREKIKEWSERRPHK